MLIRTTLLTCLSFLCSGCSSLGLSLWPAEFPLLKRTRELADASPRSAALPRELSKSVVQDYYLEPGDRLLIEPNDLDSDFRPVGDQEIYLDGSLDLGRFGRIRAAGMTVEEVEHAIEAHIRRVADEEESINVQLIETNAAEVYVLGAVGSPGAYPIDGNETVLDGLLLAGGLNSNASPCDIILVRPTNPNSCRVVLPVCYRQITQLGDVSTNYQLRPGDRIVVGSRTFCEELAVWRQSRPCKCCDRSCCVERHPQSVTYANRFQNFWAAFPLPSRPGQTPPVVEQEVLPEGSSELDDAASNRNPPLIEPQAELPFDELAPAPGEAAPAEDDDIFLQDPASDAAEQSLEQADARSVRRPASFGFPAVHPLKPRGPATKY